MKRRFAFLAALALLAALAVAPITSSAPPTDTSALRNAVTVSGIMAHEKAFQQIANRNGGIPSPPRPATTSRLRTWRASFAPLGTA